MHAPIFQRGFFGLVFRNQRETVGELSSAVLYKPTAASGSGCHSFPLSPPTAELLITARVRLRVTARARARARPTPTSTALRSYTCRPDFFPDGGLFLHAPIFHGGTRGLFLFELLNFGEKNNLLCTSK